MENFTTGLLVALQGMLIVFAVLIILMVVLYIMKLFSKEETKVSANSPVSVPVAAAEDNDEVIAVISAAVAAMSGNDPTKRLRVTSIRRQGSDTPLWSASK